MVSRLRALGMPVLVLVVADPQAGSDAREADAAAGVHRLEVGRVGDGLARLPGPA
jgi:hypothetical protein